MQPKNLLSRRLGAGTLGTYLPTRLTDGYVEAASSSSLVVVKGRGGIDLVPRLRALGVESPVILDPAEYEPLPAGRPRSTMAWAEEQRRLQVAALVSPGAYLTVSNHSRWAQLIGGETAWCAAQVDEAYVSVSVHTDALLQSPQGLAGLLASVGHPVWLSLAHSNDPLAKLGAVPALVEILGLVPRVALARSDVGAVGAAAHGAELVSIGVSSTTRHVGTSGGRRRVSNQPSVFVPTLLEWKKPEVLLGWAQRDVDILHDLVCLESCCEGAPLTRFADPAAEAEVTRHNMTALTAIHRSVVDVETPDRRRAKFSSLVGHASFQADRLAHMIPGIRPSPQIRQWRDLAP